MPLPPGTPAPSFTLTGRDGAVGLGDLLADGPAVLAFFKTTCPTCRLAFPAYGRMYDHYGEAAAVVGISQDPLATARTWLDGRGFSGAVLDDAEGGYAVSRAFAIDTVPTLVLVSQDGEVAGVVQGWDRDETNALAAQLATLVRREAVAVSTADDGLPAFKPG